jgi:hypothetical protein
VHLAISTAASALDSPTRLLEVPPGVDTSGQYYYNYNSRSNSEAQRRYNRQVQLLGTGIEPLVSSSAPDDLSVVALAWGPASPIDFSTPGHTPRTTDLNLWTANFQVRGDGPINPKLKPGSVPFVAYNPANITPWLTAEARSNSEAILGAYVDLLLRLPAGTHDGNLQLDYSVPAQGNIAVQIYDPVAGSWISIGELATDAGAYTSIAVPVSKFLVGPSGEAAWRLLNNGPNTGLDLTAIKFSLK